jgi:hypothetical protein
LTEDRFAFIFSTARKPLHRVLLDHERRFDWLMCEPDGYMIYTIYRCCDSWAASITRSLPNQPAQS